MSGAWKLLNTLAYFFFPWPPKLSLSAWEMKSGSSPLTKNVWSKSDFTASSHTPSPLLNPLCAPPPKISFQLGCFQPYVQDTSSSWKFPSLYSIYRAMFYVVYFKAWFKCPFLWEAFFIPPIGINFFHPCSTTSFVHSNNRAWMSALLL